MSSALSTGVTRRSFRRAFFAAWIDTDSARIDLASVSDLKNEDKHTVVFNFCDDAVISHPVPPLTAPVYRKPLAALSRI